MVPNSQHIPTGGFHLLKVDLLRSTTLGESSRAFLDLRLGTVAVFNLKLGGSVDLPRYSDIYPLRFYVHPSRVRQISQW